MPTLEGLTPTVLWTTLFGILCIISISLICFEVYKAGVFVKDRRNSRKLAEKQKFEAQKPDFAEKVSKTVIAELRPRFEEIEENLSKDKKRLEIHESSIASMKEGQDEIHDGLSAIAKFMLAMSLYGGIEHNDKMKEANMELQKYLTDKL